MRSLSSLLLLSLILLSCGDKREEAPKPSAKPNVMGISRPLHAKVFSPHYPSQDSLIHDFFRFLAVPDREKLNSLRVSESEFNQILWPEFPMSAPERNVPEGYAWENLDRKSVKGLTALLANFGGRNFRFLKIRFTEPEEKYSNFTVYQGSLITVREDGGQAFEGRLFGSLVEMNGSWKFMSYPE